MTEQSRVDFNLDGLEKFINEAQGYRARVGILGDKAPRFDGAELTNAEIGVVQIFGSITNGIPPRDFLLMPIQHNEQQLVKSMATAAVKAAVEASDFKKVFGLLGAVALGYVQQAFETAGFGQWAPNAPATIDKKGSSRPLIDTAQLRRAQSWDVVRKGQAV